MTMQEFLDVVKVRIRLKDTDRNPDMSGSDAMNNYKVFLVRRDDKTGCEEEFRCYFSMGSEDEPTLEEVLDSLASDARTYEDAKGFEDWVIEYGPDGGLDSFLAAYKTYKAIRRNSINLAKFLGHHYDDLILKVEPL